MFLFLFFFNDTATTEIYTLSLHDALPICADAVVAHRCLHRPAVRPGRVPAHGRLASDLRAPAVLPAPVVFCPACRRRSEEHTSELQSQSNLVCRLLLEKKKKMQLQSQLCVALMSQGKRDGTARPA